MSGLRRVAQALRTYMRYAGNPLFRSPNSVGAGGGLARGRSRGSRAKQERVHGCWSDRLAGLVHGGDVPNTADVRQRVAAHNEQIRLFARLERADQVRNSA